MATIRSAPVMAPEAGGTTPSFVALILSLPSHHATVRMRAWRSLKGWGAVVLRDGVYLLPSGPLAEERLDSLAEEVNTAGGSAEVVEVTPRTPAQAAALTALFDRHAEYLALLGELAKVDPTLPDLAVLRKTLRGLRRRHEELAAIDFFPTPLGEEVRTRLVALETVALTASEPTARTGRVEPVARADYQGRLWATRADLWVDRLASAWLIRRFIDPAARFVWLSAVADAPADGVGFDYDGARFSHVGARVTFETLLAAFGLERQPGLARLGRVIHTLDVGGEAAEAAGLTALLTGMKARLLDDDALLAEGGRILDDYLRYFAEQGD